MNPYRANRIDNGEVVEGYLGVEKHRTPETPEKKLFYVGEDRENSHFVHPASLAQNTTVKDIKDKYIFGSFEIDGEMSRGGDEVQYYYDIDSKAVFGGFVEYHDKILEIGWEHDETRFVGFVLRCCPNTNEEYFVTIPEENLKIIGTQWKGTG